MIIPDTLELSLIGPFILGLDIAHCLDVSDNLADSGFTGSCFKTHSCKVAWEKMREWHLKNEFTAEKLVSFCNQHSAFGNDSTERFLWSADAARNGSALNLAHNGYQLLEMRMREHALEVIESAGNGESSETILDDLEAKILTLRSKLVVSKSSKCEKVQACDDLSNELEAMSRGECLLKSSKVRVWDQCLGGLPEAQIIILSGRPGGGKTSLAEQIIDEAVRDGTPTLYIQRELSRTRAIGRLAARRANVPWSKVEMRKLSQHEIEALTKSVEEYRKLPIFLAPVSTCNAATINTLVRHHHRQNGIKLIVMDYVQLIDCPKNTERRVAIGDVTRCLKQLANVTGCSIIAIAQLSRGVDKKAEKPSLSDLKESGDIEQDADVVLSLWTSKDRDDNARWPINWSVLKNRNGPTGTTEVMFDGPSMSFLGSTTNKERE